jgi:hypothetical protein
LEQTLSVEIFYGGASRVLELSPVFGEEGAYTAVIIPSEEGDYTWRIFGEIEGTPVDVSLTSGPDTFSPVINFEGEAFPGDTLTSGQLGKAVDQARSLANISLVIGSVGLILGLAALAISLRRQARTPTTGK